MAKKKEKKNKAEKIINEFGCQGKKGGCSTNHELLELNFPTFKSEFGKEINMFTTKL